MTSASGRWPVRDALWFAAALILAGQWIVTRSLGVHLQPPLEAILPGVGIFGAAFMLSWAAELAQLEISQALALAFLALMAVLPEYAVDLYLAWTAAKDPSYTALAAANMTGANRILIGFGWPVILFCYWLRSRQREIKVESEQRVDLAALLVATVYAFLIPLKRTLSLVDTAFLVGLFAVYVVQSGKAHHVEPELEGPPARIALLPRAWRRLATIALFLLPGYTIFIAAEPFAEGLMRCAEQLNVPKFVLIQWLAPLASESPEFIVAILFALKGNPMAGFGTLISSKVNQWTLLIGMLPLAYSASGRHLQPMVLDARQAEEILLTAAQSLLAVIMLTNWSFGLGEAVLLFALFIAQLAIPIPWVHLAFAGLYVVLALGYLVMPSYRNSVKQLLVSGWRVSPRQDRS